MIDPAKLCVYCVKKTLTGRERSEHPISAALGSSLTVPTVCDPCNLWAGREIDQPLLEEDLLRAHRSLVDQRDPRRGKKARRVASPILRGYTADGDYVAFDHERGRPVVASRIVDLGDGRIHVRAGSRQEANRLLEKVRARATADGHEAHIQNEEWSRWRPEIKANLALRPDIWRRAAAKIGLAVGSVVYPSAWRLSADAEQLRGWIHNRDPTTNDGTAPPLVPTRPPANWGIIQGDEHLVCFTGVGDQTTAVIVVFFGATCFAVPVDTTRVPVPTQAWRLDWRAPQRDGMTTWDQLVIDAIVRAQAEQQDI